MTAGACILGCAGTRLGAGEAAFFREADPWGFILFSRNVDTPEQLRRLTDDLRGSVGRDAPILIDQEGGRVQRLRPPYWRPWSPPLDHVRAAGAAAERAMYLRSRLMADELHALGIDVNCAPSADVARPETHPFLANRCYGSEPGLVAGIARAVAQGLLAGGVLPVLKHIPGHGRGTRDSHLALPVVSATRRDLEAEDFAPFAALADLPMAMTAHIVYGALDESPATQSRSVIALIREQIGFGGLLMTDDISMEALGGSIAVRSRAAMDAGCDLILHCNGERPEMEEAVSEAGRFSAAAAARADQALAMRAAPDDADIAALERELDALLAG
ncbi:beta-N-acetylhexosaminidase [Profundibacterium mesophilum]|uniref:beta-N-acetylhexosaminidase n=1 Tax=Profundibacterium mesophilum KAUST100406-0324 TaxID=1037889 RepID=A0A921TCW2_9RHOB|nr:beta-N-acetylhexosaminidase [Profundibacterium mesophilum]KAF0677610.1 beta-N-acetylhexosaminidase [Profundibacterium mesophilum KAUST100406-0324]